MDKQRRFVASANKGRCADCGFCHSVLDCFSTFRRQDPHRPRPSEMLGVKRVPEGTGLCTVAV